MNHSRLSPSAAYRWTECPGSVKLSEGLSDSDTSFSKEGQLAHAMAEKWLQSNRAPAGDAEMVEYVRTYVGRIRQDSKGCEFFIFEHEIDLSTILGEGGIGTCDFLCVFPDRIEIHDLKYGKGIKVYAEKNLQLILYAIGVLRITGLMYSTIQNVRLCIHQPRLEHFSEHTYTVNEIQVFEKYLEKCAEAALSPSAILVPGEKQCRFCPAKTHGKCPAIEKQCLDMFDKCQEIDTTDPDGAKIAKILPQLDLMELWIKAFRESALKYAQTKPIPGYKIVRGNGRRKWADEEEVMKLLDGKEEAFTKKLIGPAQMLKLFKDDSTIVKMLGEHIVKSEGGLMLVSESDNRVEYAPVKPDDFD